MALLPRKSGKIKEKKKTLQAKDDNKDLKTTEINPSRDTAQTKKNSDSFWQNIISDFKKILHSYFLLRKPTRL